MFGDPVSREADPVSGQGQLQCGSQGIGRGLVATDRHQIKDRKPHRLHSRVSSSESTLPRVPHGSGVVVVNIRGPTVDTRAR